MTDDTKGAKRRGFDKFDYMKRICEPPHSETLKLSEFRVLVAVWNFSDAAGGRARPGADLLARNLGYSNRSKVDDLLRVLRAKGYLTVERVGGGQGRATSYALTLPAVADVGAWDDLDDGIPGHGDRGSMSTNPPEVGGGSDWANLPEVGGGSDAEPPPTRGRYLPQIGVNTSPKLGEPSDQEQITDQSAHPNPSNNDQLSDPTVATVWVDRFSTNRDALKAPNVDDLEAERARQLKQLQALTEEGGDHADT